VNVAGFLPPGSGELARWAYSRGMGFSGQPDQAWFRAWEPYDTLITPAFYYSACTLVMPPGSITVAEPWIEESGLEPLDRTLLAFVSHPNLTARAAARVGEHFLTRVAFLTDPPPPRIEIGDASWDAQAVTHAVDWQQARTAFRTKMRRLLESWSFKGHIEMRPGGAVIFMAGLRPTPPEAERLVQSAMQIVAAAFG
jgi:hypothetical protein